MNVIEISVDEFEGGHKKGFRLCVIFGGTKEADKYFCIYCPTGALDSDIQQEASRSLK